MTEVKLCECGCGLPAPIAPRTHSSKGIFRGQPYRFISGHGSRQQRVEPPVHTDKTAIYIPLTRGEFALVDVNDYEWLSQHVWFYTSGYAARAEDRHTIFMHNMIMRPPPGTEVDHYNLNKLDNRRSNLRLCNHTQNLANVRSKKGTSSYKGVSWCKRDRQWLAQIQAYNKSYRLGQFDDEIAAALAYDAAARMHFGEFAHCNFPPEDK